MAKRTVRVNELMLREISEILHTRFQAETVGVTVTKVDVAPDLRQARISYAVFGGAEENRLAERFFARYRGEIRRQMARRITLKYLPDLHFRRDDGVQEGQDLLALMDELEEERRREEESS